MLGLNYDEDMVQQVTFFHLCLPSMLAYWPVQIGPFRDCTLLTNLHSFHLLLQMFACIDAFTSNFHILSFGFDIDCSLSFLFLTSSVFALKKLWVAGTGEGENKKKRRLSLRENGKESNYKTKGNNKKSWLDRIDEFLRKKDVSSLKNNM